MKRNIRYIAAVLFTISTLLVGCGDASGPPEVASFEPSFGPSETLITVQGMNFVDLVAINFDEDVPADFNPSFGKEDALLFRVPLDAPLGENNILIKTSEGEVTFPFRVTLKAPKVLNLSPKSANQGEVISITGENFFEPLEVLFFDSIPGNIVFNSPDSLAIEVPAGVQRGRIKVKANGGSALTAELFFSTLDILVNDFDGNGLRSETNKWLFYGNINENANNAVQASSPDPINGNFLKVSGTDPGSVWVGGTESNSFDAVDFPNFGIQSSINNTFISLDVNSNGRKHTHLIIVLTERDGSFNDFTETVQIDWDGWENISFPLNRFTDVNGAAVNPAKVKNVKLHLYNEEGSNQPLEINVDNLKFIQIN